MRLNNSLPRTNMTTNTKIALTSAIVGIAALVVNIAYSNYTIGIDNEINRPYLNVDASQMEQQLRIAYSNPNQLLQDFEDDTSTPFNSYFSFDVYNVGKLPAKYSIDLSQFHPRILGVNKILPPLNSEGILFPNQSTTIKYEMQGINDPNLQMTKDQIETFFSRPSSIIVLYGYLGDSSPDFETMISEAAVQQNCDTLPTPGEECYPANWVVTAIK